MPDPQTLISSVDRNWVAPVRQSPRQNHLLAALPAADYLRLLPHLEGVVLPAAWIMHSAGDRERDVHFPTAGIVARLHVTANGASTEFAVTGNEGVIGVAAFLGGESTVSRAAVVSAGFAYRVGADVLRRELDHGGPLLRLLLRYTLALMTQTALSAVCNRHHSLEQRLCRLILSCLDRLPSNELAMTQALIAEMLGVRRVGVTDAVGRLHDAGLIDSSRGHIAVLDRSRLRARACECYAVVRREYGRLLCPEPVVACAAAHGARTTAFGACAQPSGG